MTDEAIETLQQLVQHLGRYSEEAFVFVREGLSHAAHQVHGPETEAHRRLQEYLIAHHIDWDDLVARYHASQLPPDVLEAIDEAGGYEKLNRQYRWAKEPPADSRMAEFREIFLGYGFDTTVH